MPLWSFLEIFHTQYWDHDAVCCYFSTAFFFYVHFQGKFLHTSNEQIIVYRRRLQLNSDRCDLDQSVFWAYTLSQIQIFLLWSPGGMVFQTSDAIEFESFNHQTKENKSLCWYSIDIDTAPDTTQRNGEIIIDKDDDGHKEPAVL